MTKKKQDHSTQGGFAFPQEWTLFGPAGKNDPEPDFAGLTAVPKVLTIAAKKLAGQRAAFTDNRLDLGALLGGRAVGKTAYLFAEFAVASDMEIELGAGADWWMKWWVNGAVVCDTTARGNDVYPLSPTDHRFTARLKAGKNLVAVKVGSGSGSFMLAAGGPREMRESAGEIERAAQDLRQWRERQAETAGESPAWAQLPSDIRLLTQHFNQPGGGIEPWLFVPESNIAELSTAEHPGTATIRQAGRGQDIKGLLRRPIGIGDYPLPWEFQMSLVQNPMAVLLGVGDTRQNNTAIGLNVALTFSDPSTWPADRTQRPPDTHDFQLLIVHLGNTGEFGAGLRQFAPYRTPETHLVCGRGDLAPTLNGDWKIPYFFQGSMPDAGPASPQAFFRFCLSDPNAFSVGIKFNDWNEFYLRGADCSRFGEITGVWEIGPILSCDRWIPDVLCRELPVLHPEIKDPPEPIAPNPIHEFTVDYCAFLPCAPTAPFESFSDEFDVPGFLNWRGFQLPFQAETWSHPGQLTVTLLGASQGTWLFPMTLTEIDLTAYPPPWEWEVCFTPPAPPAPWNLYFNHRLIDPRGQWKTYWKPGVMYDPQTRQARFTNDPFGPSSFDSQLEDYFRRNGQDPAQLKPWVKVQMVFDPVPPQEVLQARPLRMLYQMLDKRHLRMGFRGSAEGPWHLSQVMDVTEVMGGDIAKLGETCLGIVNGRHFSLPGGMPMYAQYRFDYIRFRDHLTAGTEGRSATS